MRRLLPFLLALVLGVGSAVLVACGDSGTEGGLPQAEADMLASEFADIQEFTDNSRCSDLPGQLRQINELLDNVPSSVDPQLVDRLREAQTQLVQDNLAVDECQDSSQPEEPADTATEETPTETEPAPIEPDPSTTETEPAPIEPDPSTNETEPTDPVDPETPDPGLPPLDDDTLPPDQGGGTSPEIP